MCFRNPESRAGHRFWFSVVLRTKEAVCSAAEKRYETHAAGTRECLRLSIYSRYYTSSWAVAEFFFLHKRANAREPELRIFFLRRNSSYARCSEYIYTNAFARNRFGIVNRSDGNFRDRQVLNANYGYLKISERAPRGTRPNRHLVPSRGP